MGEIETVGGAIHHIALNQAQFLRTPRNSAPVITFHSTTAYDDCTPHHQMQAPMTPHASTPINLRFDFVHPEWRPAQYPANEFPERCWRA
jgi:hypothetical protein